jgi:ribosome-associated protein
VDALEEKKGENILLLDIHEVASFTDYFIICNGTSDRMINALADAVVEKVKKETDYPIRIEGQSAPGWEVIDLGDVIVHIFSPVQRDYYRLEELWNRGKVVMRLQ